MVGDAWPDVVIACNDIGCTLQRLDHWCTLHPEKLDAWRAVRAVHRPADDHYETWIRPMPLGVERPTSHYDHEIQIWGGSSGLMCVQVALQVGADRVICAGIPLENRPHFNKREAWRHPSQYRTDWERRKDMGMLDNVRSCSGWTRELLGGPDEWLTK